MQLSSAISSASLSADNGQHPVFTVQMGRTGGDIRLCELLSDAARDLKLQKRGGTELVKLGHLCRTNIVACWSQKTITAQKLQPTNYLFGT